MAKGPYHKNLGNGGHVTSKHRGNGGGVKNPKAVSYTSVKNPRTGGKTSMTFMSDGRVKSERCSKGGFFGGKPKKSWW